MTRMFIRHAVNDFDTWKQAYDDFSDTQQRLGVTSESVFRDANDPSSVTVIHDFDDQQTAEAFAGSDEVKQAMGDAGVAGPPDIWFAEEV